MNGYMKMKRFAVITLSILVVTLTGCQMARGDNEFGGNVIGAGLGGLVGAQFGSGKGQIITAVVGALIGSQIGGNIGRNMDDSDRARAGSALSNVPAGRSAKWYNNNTNQYHEIEPRRETYDTSTRRVCRGYTHYVIMDGVETEVEGDACRESNGTWKIVNRR
jgi:surface antigen